MLAARHRVTETLVVVGHPGQRRLKAARILLGIKCAFLAMARVSVYYALTRSER